MLNLKALFRKPRKVKQVGSTVKYLEHGNAVITGIIETPSEGVWLIELAEMPEGFTTSKVVAFDYQLSMVA